MGEKVPTVWQYRQHLNNGTVTLWETDTKGYREKYADKLGVEWRALMTVAQHELIVAGLEGGVLAAFPTNWCDPLLTGDKAAVGSPPYGCPDIERLIRAIKRRVSDAFLAQTAEGK